MLSKDYIRVSEAGGVGAVRRAGLEHKYRMDKLNELRSDNSYNN